MGAMIFVISKVTVGHLQVQSEGNPLCAPFFLAPILLSRACYAS